MHENLRSSFCFNYIFSLVWQSICYQIMKWQTIEATVAKLKCNKNPISHSSHYYFLVHNPVFRYIVLRAHWSNPLLHRVVNKPNLNFLWSRSEFWNHRIRIDMEMKSIRIPFCLYSPWKLDPFQDLLQEQPSKSYKKERGQILFSMLCSNTPWLFTDWKRNPK